MTLSERLAQAATEHPCIAVDRKTGDRCTRTDPHRPDDIHQRGAHTWGARPLPPRPRWLDHIQARELTGSSL